jgi:hypothetical protein
MSTKDDPCVLKRVNAVKGSLNGTIIVIINTSVTVNISHIKVLSLIFTLIFRINFTPYNSYCVDSDRYLVGAKIRA